MKLFGLLLRNLLFHWRGNLAVLLGIVVGTAVLTGALLVGDSLRGSLRDLTEQRLGWIDNALIGPRFLREDLAKAFDADGVSPALVMRGTLSEPDSVRVVRKVNVLGIDTRFWNAGQADNANVPGGADLWSSDEKGVVLNEPLARALALQMKLDDVRTLIGKTIELRVQKASEVPRETLLGDKTDRALVGDVQLVVKAILSKDEFGYRFSLQPTAEIPFNAFVPLPVMQKAVEQPGKVNAFFVDGGSVETLQKQLESSMTLDDWGLDLVGPAERTAELFGRLDRSENDVLEEREWTRFRGGERKPRFSRALAEQMAAGAKELKRSVVEQFFRDKHNYLSLQSKQLLLENVVSKAALAAATEVDLRAAPTLVYLANTISDGEHEIPYALVAALDPTLGPPLGPFLPEGETKLGNDEILLVDWEGSPLVADQGREITLVYYPPEQHGEYTEESTTFTAAGVVPLKGAALDPYLTPELPGVTDQIDIRSWNPPFKFDRSRIKAGDINEQFWELYRTTPKAYITLTTGQKIWGSRFGKTTSIRLAPKSGSLADARTAFGKALLKKLSAKNAGLEFLAMREEALKASKGGGFDFAMLFLGFSFFLIVAALLLVGLLVRLNIDRRASEIGLLMATGYRRSTVRRLLLGEGALLALIGAGLGCVVAVLYSQALLQLLQTLWPGGALGSFLRPHVTWMSLAIGLGSSFLVSVLTIFWAVRVLGTVAPVALLAGQTSESDIAMSAESNWSRRIAIVSVVLAVALLAMTPMIHEHEAKAGSFFGSGALLLTACLALFWGWMKRSRHETVSGSGWWSIAQLGVRNSARYPSRSLLTAGLLASAAFLLVAVEAFRRSANVTDAKDSSSGGFTLLAESDLPVIKNLNHPDTRADLLDKLQLHWQNEGFAGEKLTKKLKRAEDLLGEKLVLYSFRVQGGDDASCLNLYQPRRPRVLGVPQALIERGGFVFASTTTDEENPWNALEDSQQPLPTFGEKNSVVWMLKIGLGDPVVVPDGAGDDAQLRIAGLLLDSIFQSGLLVSEQNFLDLYPTVEGWRFFLIQAPPGEEEEIAELLEIALADRGFAVTPTRDRLAAYLAVESTYLSTFQALGALGLLLGSLGLAIVLLRGVWERRAELALLRALGYRRITLAWLVLAENGFLLIVGLVAGTVSAALAVAPHLLSQGGDVAWLHLLQLLGLVLVVALTAGGLAVASTLRAPLIPALRKE